MEDDLLIKESAKEYVKDNVEVSVYKTEPRNYWRNYTLQLDYNIYRTAYELENRYCISKSYIMRVVSDLCFNLAKITQRKRNDFFKISDEEGGTNNEL